MLINIGKKNIKLITTADIYLCMLIRGLSTSITGPYLLDLQRLVNTDIQHMAFLNISRHLGILVGAMLGGVAFDLVRSKMLVMVICNFFVSLSMFKLPWSRSLGTLLGIVIINGLSLGVVSTGSNVIIIDLWGSGPALQALYFAFGLGDFVAPLIAVPFLEDSKAVQNLSNTNNYSWNETFATNTTRTFSENTFYSGTPKIVYPFSIIGVFALLVAILCLVTCLISPFVNSGSQTENDDNSDRSCCFVCCSVLFTILVLSVLVGSGAGFVQNLAAYAVKGKLQATPVVASYFTSAYWGAYMVVKFICIFLSIRFSNWTFIITDIFLISVAGVMLLFFMPSEGVLWAVAVIFGSGVATVHPSMFGWIADYIKVTNKISAILNVGLNVGEIIVPSIILYFMDTIPEILAYVILTSSIISIVSLLSFKVIIRMNKKKWTPKQQNVVL